ncbi:MAG: hypothetical protein Q8R28_18090 [Dehalococcoidia bacterium]|nr:hypothetical protein [Dehalococcoidia bacterium]
MASVTSTTADKFIDEVWSAELNRAIEFKLVIAALFSDWTSKMRSSGDVFHLPNRHNLTAATKSAGSDATPEAITETEQNFTVSTHQIVAQEIEDFAEVMSKYDIRSEYTKAASYALGRAMDVAAAALLDDNTTQTVGVLGAEITDDNLIRAWQYLQDSAANPPFKGVVSPGCWGGLLKVEKFIQALYNGDTKGRALHEAEIGRIYQSKVHVSNLTVGTAPNSSGHLWAEDHFFKIVKKSPKQDAWFSPLAKAWVVATDQIYGIFEREEADEAAAVTTDAKLWGVRLQSLK